MHDARYTLLNSAQPTTDVGTATNHKTAESGAADPDREQPLVGFFDPEYDANVVGALENASIGLNDRSGSWAAWNQTKGLYSESHAAQRYFRRGQAFECSENQMNWFVLRRAQVRWRILAIRIRFIVLMRSNGERRAAEDKRS